MKRDKIEQRLPLIESEQSTKPILSALALLSTSLWLLPIRM